MAIDLSKFIDNSLKSEFEAKPYDIGKDRAKLTRKFELALNQIKQGQTRGAHKLWKISNGVVEFTVPHGSGALNIGGSTTNYIPESQFPGFVAALIDATNAGEFDGALKAVDVAPAASTRAPKRERNVGEASRLNIRVGGFRRGGKSDADIRKLLAGEGVEKAAIDAAIAYKRPGK